MESMPRLSAVEAEILHLLIVHGEMYGLQMLEAAPTLKRGSIYVTLGRMADKGFVTSRAVKSPHESGMPRRLFEATGLGKRVFDATQIANATLREAFA